MSCNRACVQATPALSGVGVPAGQCHAVFGRVRPAVGDIRWSDREALDCGGFAVIYRVASGVVAKVGPELDRGEAERQRYFAGRGQALPVYDFQEGVAVPPEVSRECCPCHGYRRDVLFEPEEQWGCTCNEPVSVLLMPEAGPAGEEYDSEEGRALFEAVAGIMLARFGRVYDDRPSNLGRWKGRLVALDFGEELS